MRALRVYEWETVRKEFNPKGLAFTDICLALISRNYGWFLETGAMVYIEEAERIALSRNHCDFLTFLKG